MLALGAMTLVLVLHSKRKLLSISLFLVLGTILFVQLPEQWIGRMESTASYQSDQSAQGRIQVWHIGMDLVRDHPITGGGFNAWQVLPLSDTGGLNWHSAYVQILAEHGYVGLALWVGLLAGTLVSLTWGGGQPAWARDHCAMLQAALMAYLVGGLTLGIAYWELPYHLVVLAALIRRVPSAMEPARQA
jgi:probable O-glycosylation ligase (exosortase A-associated)